MYLSPVIMVNFVMFSAITEQVVMGTVCVMSMFLNLRMISSEGKCICLWDYYGETCNQFCTDQTTCNNHGSCVAGGMNGD